MRRPPLAPRRRPTRRPGSARPSGRPGSATVLVLALAVLLGSGSARAECVLDGTEVTCSGIDPDGFDGSALDDLLVDVLVNSEVFNSGDGTAAIAVGEDSHVQVHRVIPPDTGVGGIVTADGVGSRGVEAGPASAVYNYGTIQATGDGASAVWVKGEVGKITPYAETVYNGFDGTITGGSGSGTAVRLGDQNSDDGPFSFTNRGKVFVTGDGSAVLGSGGADSIETSGELEGAIFLWGGNDTVSNGGTMKGAVDLGAGDDALTNRQTGSIEGDIDLGDGDDTLANYTGGEITGNIDLGAGGNSLDNAGTITGAVHLGAGYDALTNRATGSIEGDIDLGDGGSRLTNWGTITGAVSLGTGDDMLNNVDPGSIEGDIDLGDGDNTLSNSGTITGDVDFGAGDDEFGNTGSIDGDIDLGDGDDRFVLYSVGSVTGIVEGGGHSTGDTYVLGGIGGATFDLSSDFPTSFERLEINTTGTWSLRGSGTYTGDTTVVNGTVALEGYVQLPGDYTQGEDTQLQVVLTPDGPEGVLDVGGDVTIETGTTLDLRTNGGLLESGTYPVLTWSGDRSGMFEEDAADWATEVLEVESVYNDGLKELQVILTRHSYASAVYGNNPRAIAAYLDGAVPLIPMGDYEDFASMLAALDGLGANDLQLAMAELSPEAYDAQTSAALSWGRGFTSVLKRRPLRCQRRVYQALPGVHSESPCGEKGWMPWAEPLGHYAKRDGGRNYLSHDRLGSGLAVGVDRRLGERWSLSAGLAAGRIGMDFDGLGNGTLTAFDFGGGASLLLGPAHVRALASYGHGWHTTRRDFDFLRMRATGDHDSNRLGLLLEAGYEFALGPVRIEPLVEVDYTYIHETKVAEEGAGASSLRVDRRSNSQVGTAAGLRVSGSYYKYAYLGEYLEWLDGVITPELSARWRRVWSGDDRDVEAHMAGAPGGAGEFQVAADDASAGLELAALIRFQPQWTRNTVELGYQVFLGNDTTVHNLGAKLRIPF